MQHYIKYGLGIDSKCFTEEQVENIYYNGQKTHKRFGLEFFSFTENYEGKDWGTVVVKNFGEFPNAGKMATYQEIKQLCAKEENITKEDKEAILEVLKKYNLEHLIDKVELIIYSDNY